MQFYIYYSRLVYVFCYRKLNGIPLLFIASLVGIAEGKLVCSVQGSAWEWYETYSSTTQSV